MIEEIVIKNDEIRDVLRDELNYLSRKIVRRIVERYESTLSNKGVSLGQMFKDDLNRRLVNKVEKTITLKLKISIDELNNMEYNGEY